MQTDIWNFEPIEAAVLNGMAGEGNHVVAFQYPFSNVDLKEQWRVVLHHV